MLFDSHAHLNFEEFNDDYREVIKECQKQEVMVNNVGSQLATSKRAVAIAEEFEQGVFASVGLHPIHVLGSTFHPENFESSDYQQLIESSDKVVAIGETGIDFYHDPDNLKSQQEVFIKHLTLAKTNSLPVIIHARNSKDGKSDAYDLILDLVRKEKIVSGVIHCFGGSLPQARQFVELGFFVGFTGVITFDKTGLLETVVKALPLEKILVETDCPYLAPVPFRGQRNLPTYVRQVAEKIAEIKEIDYNKVRETTYQNTIRLFNT